MLLPPRTAVQDVATATCKLPCTSADNSTPNQKFFCGQRCQNTPIGCGRPGRRAQHSHVLLCKAEIAEADVGPSTVPEAISEMDFETENSTASLPSSDTWELDFSSRPILDSRGKKRWELLICSPDRSWIYSKWFPNNKINSTQVSCLLAPVSDGLTSSCGGSSPQHCTISESVRILGILM